MVATTNKLSGLHGRLADAMSEALDAEVERIELTRRLYEVDVSELDEDTARQLSTALTLAPTARVDNALLKTVSAFLKDNNITSDLGEAGDEDEKLERLRALKARRSIATTPADMLN